MSRSPRGRSAGRIPRRFALLAGVLAGLLLLPAGAGAQAPDFGLSAFTMTRSSTQAGAHADLTTAFKFNEDSEGLPVGQVKDMQVTLPAGQIGDPQATPKCSLVELELYSCKPSAQLGLMAIESHIGSQAIPAVNVPLYNLVPTPGHVATFGATLLFVKIMIQTDLSSDGSYRFVVTLHDLSTLVPITGASLTIWGVPASPTHDLERWLTQLGGPKAIYQTNEFEEREVIGYEPTPAGVAPQAFLSNPTDCSQSELTATVAVDSWQQPDQQVTRSTTAPPVSGCDKLQIDPTLTVRPGTTQRDTPSGYDIDVKYPLSEDPGALATPNLRQATVTLPEGTSLSPGLANGLLACSDAQFAAGACPDASKVGTVAITTPVLPEQLTGTVNIGAPTATDMYRVFLTATSKTVTVHLTGILHPDPNTGRLTVVIDNAPQLPFSELFLHVFGGPGAALTNPVSCGAAGSSAQLLSYGGQSAEASSSFAVDADGAGGACAGPGFSPSFSAGTVSPLAGAFSPFVLNVARADAQQTLSTIATQLPPGLLGTLLQVPRCEEPQAAQGSCSAVSQIGSITIGSGSGGAPFYMQAPVYLTGPYKGAPFGLSIPVHAIAGPFDLGRPVIRATIAVDPTDAHLTIVSDPFPQILSGIPLRVRTVAIDINQSNLILNPTSCVPQAVGGTIGSAAGTSVTLTSPFQVIGCRALPFAPKLTASTTAKTSRADGTALDMKLSYPAGSQAHIHTVVVELPKQLRPRLTTIQQACRKATLDTDPAACPTGSRVGTGSVNTPVFSTPLTGPIYLVANGGLFPRLVMMLQSQGVRIDLEGVVRISSTGITRTEFDAVPDVPINSLELNMPQGRYSALGSATNLCTSKPKLNYTLTGYNGAQVKQGAAIAVSACPHVHKKASTHPKSTHPKSTHLKSSKRRKQ